MKFQFIFKVFFLILKNISKKVRYFFKDIKSKTRKSLFEFYFVVVTKGVLYFFIFFNFILQ